MNDLLPQAYLIGLIVLLAGIAAVIGRQILRVRRDELIMGRLGSKAAGKDSGNSSEDLYTLASVQLRKRLYGQAADNLRKALRKAESENAPDEAIALIQNALGFSLAAQDNYQQSVRHYRAALKARADYPVALNNLAFALEKLKREGEALELYTRVLQLEAGNRTASKRLRLLERRGVSPQDLSSSGTGMGD